MCPFLSHTWSAGLDIVFCATTRQIVVNCIYLIIILVKEPSLSSSERRKEEEPIHVETGKESLQTPSQNLMGKKMYMPFLIYVYSERKKDNDF